jgi:hypothetical protein
MRSTSCILAALFLVLAVQAPLNATPPGKEDPGNRSAGSTPTAATAPAPSSAVEQLASAKPARKDSPRCRKGNDDRTSELCAQWKAADAADESAFWARWSVLLALAGTLGLFMTIWYTRKAVRLAMDASRDTEAALAIAERNANAAAAQVEVTKDTATKQLRAYVGVNAANYTFNLNPDGTAGFGAGLEVANFGQTPAYRFRHVAMLSLRPYPCDGLSELGSPDGPTHTLFPSMKTYINMGLPLDSQQTRALQSGQLCLFIQAVAEYEDIGGFRHVQTIRYVSHSSSPNMNFHQSNAGQLTFHSGEDI